MTRKSTTAPPDPDLAAEFRAERQAARIGSLTARMPPVFHRPGQLHADVKAWVDRVAAGEHPNLLLVGDVGVGKTWHAWHAPLAALEAGWDGRVDVVTADDFRARIAPADDGGQFGRQVLMGSVDLLVLDDVGALRATDWMLEGLWAVVNRRHEQQLPTVVTSNVADLQAELGARVSSRLAADAVLVVLDGPDRRRAG